MLHPGWAPGFVKTLVYLIAGSSTPWRTESKLRVSSGGGVRSWCWRPIGKTAIPTMRRPGTRNAAVYCTLKKSNDPNPPHKPLGYLYYLLHHFTHPGMVVDISSLYPRKLELLRMHASQFAKTAEGFGVLPLGMNDYLFGLESRDRFFGSLIGVHHGEAFVSEVPLKLGSISDLLSLR